MRAKTDFSSFFPLVALTFLLLSTVVPGLAWAADAPPYLLLETAATGKAVAKTAWTAKRWMQINKAALRKLAGGTITAIQLSVPGDTVTLERTRLQRRTGTTTWSGRDADGNTEALLTLGSDFFFGRVVRDGRIIIYRPDPETRECIVEELDPAAEASSAEDIRLPQEEDVEETTTPYVAKSTSDKTTATDDGSVIDVMVLYSTGLRQEIGGTDLVQAKIQHLIDLTNDAYDNSRIHTRLRLVHSKEVNYDDTIVNGDALDQLSDNSGVFAGVEELRDRYGADQVTLLRKYLHSGDGCGTAWLLTSNWPEGAYAVVRNGTIQQGNTTYYCDDLAYSHEVGHNLGCAHDRDHTHSEGWYSYSHGYQFQVPDGNWYRTVMSYPCSDKSCPRVTHFSNPNVDYQGGATGVAEGSPDSADNSRTIEQTRTTVANFRPSQEPDGSDEPDIAVSPTAHDFGTIDVGTRAETTFVVDNKGKGNLEIGNIETPALPFRIETDTCSNQVLTSGEECTIKASFAPTSPGSASATITIASNDPDTPKLDISLSGTGESRSPMIQAQPTALVFSPVAPGGASEQDVVLKNLGLADLHIGTIGSDDPLAPPFSLVDDKCSRRTLGPDQTCRFTVRYAPGSPGEPDEDLLSIPSDDPKRRTLTIRITARHFPWTLFLPNLLNQWHRVPGAR